jgi:PIN domain nuclease of toxin-antitoxin system
MIIRRQVPWECRHLGRRFNFEETSLSAVVYWEVMLKSMEGMLEVGDPRTWWLDALDQMAATSMPLRPEHVAAVYHLPPIHRDPFDRVLVAQATVEELILVTTDGEISRYASERFRVIH